MAYTKRIGFIFWLLITAIPILGLVWSVLSPQDFRSWQAVSRSWADRLGLMGPAVFVMLQVAQVVVTPISHYTVGAIGGYLYGPLWGGVLNYVGRVVGHCLAFALAKRYGRRCFKRYLDERTITRYDRIFAGSSGEKDVGTLQPFILFLVFFLPFFPDDEISYLVGASRMPVRPYLVANFFGQLGGAFSLAYLGSGVSTEDIWFWVLTISTLAGFPAIWLAMRWRARRVESAQETRP